MKRSEKTHIEFDCDDGIHYKLEITAASLKKAEKAGVKFGQMSDMPFTAPETIFWIACLQNHPTVTQKYATKLYKSLKRTADNREAEFDDDGEETDGLGEILIQMMNEACEELSGRAGNRSWSVT